MDTGKTGDVKNVTARAPDPGSVVRRMSVVMSLDAVGYTRMMRDDETATADTLWHLGGEVIEPTIAAFGGRIVKRTGDGLLVEFNAASAAVGAAQRIQHALHERQVDVPAARRLEFRIGINIADVIERDNDIFGDGVNVAARLQSESPAGRIAVSRGVRDQLLGHRTFGFECAGMRRFRNIDEPVEVFLVTDGGAARSGFLRHWKKAVVAGVAAAAVALVAVSVPWDTAALMRAVGIAPAFAAPPRVAVLPFRDATAGEDRNILADALAEDLIIDLSRFSEFSVIARNSSFGLLPDELSPDRVRAALDARFVIDGAVQRLDGQIRVSAQLTDTHSGEVIWAERFERPSADIFDVQHELVSEIIGRLAPEVSRADKRRVSTRPPESLAAWELYLRARAFFFESFTAESAARAMGYLERARALDPTYAPAYALAGYIRAFQWMYRWGDDFETGREDGLVLADRAVALDPTSGVGYWARCHVLRFIDPVRALPHCARAVEINPNSTDYLAAYAFALDWARDLDRSLEVVQRAARLSPRAPELDIYHFFHAHALFHLGRYEDAIAAVDAAQDAMRGQIWKAWMRFVRAGSLAKLGRVDEARPDMELGLQYMPWASLKWMRETFTRAPLHPTSRDEWGAAMAKAGMPETR